MVFFTLYQNEWIFYACPSLNGANVRETARSCVHAKLFSAAIFFVLFAAQNGTVSAVTVVINTKLPAVVKLRAGNMQLRLSAARARVLNYHS